MKVSELKRRLKQAGCLLYREGRRHEIWVNPANGHKTQVSRHGSEEVKPKTLQSIMSELFG